MSVFLLLDVESEHLLKMMGCLWHTKEKHLLHERLKLRQLNRDQDKDDKYIRLTLSICLMLSTS